MSKINNILKTILGTVLIFVMVTGCVHSDNPSLTEQGEEFSTEDVYTFGPMTEKELYILGKIQEELDFFFSEQSLDTLDDEVLYEIKDTRVLNVEWEDNIIRINFARGISDVLGNPDAEDRFASIVGYGIDQALFDHEEDLPEAEFFYGGIPKYKYYEHILEDIDIHDIHPNLELNILKDQQYLKDGQSGSLGTLGLQNKKIVTNAGHGYYFRPEKGKKAKETFLEYQRRVLSDELKGKNGEFTYNKMVYVEPIREDIATAELTMLLNTLMRNAGAKVYPIREENKKSGRGSITGKKKWEEAGRYNLMRLLKDLPASEKNNIINRFGFLGNKNRKSRGIINFLDIYSRPLYANHINASAYISIHTNGHKGKARGLEIYRPIKNCLSNGEHLYKNQSKYLAIVVFAAMLGEIRNDFSNFPSHTSNPDEYKAVKTDSKAEIRCANQPAILVEVAYHDNVQDAVLLANQNFRRLAMQGVADGVEAYFDGIRGPPEPKFPKGKSTEETLSLKWKPWEPEEDRKYNVHIYSLVDGKVKDLVYEKKNLSGNEHQIDEGVLEDKQRYRWTVGVVYSGNKNNELKELKSLTHLDFVANISSNTIDINISGNPASALVCLEGPDRAPLDPRWRGCKDVENSISYENLHSGTYTIYFWEAAYRREGERYFESYYPVDPNTDKFPKRNERLGRRILKIQIMVKDGEHKEQSIKYRKYTASLKVSTPDNLGPTWFLVKCRSSFCHELFFAYQGGLRSHTFKGLPPGRWEVVYGVTGREYKKGCWKTYLADREIVELKSGRTESVTGSYYETHDTCEE